MTFSDLSALIGANFKMIRDRKKLSQEIVAQRLQVATARISEFETGKTNPTLNTIVKYAEAIEVDILDLFDFGALRNDNDIAKKEVLIHILCSTLEKRDMKEIQYIFDATNDFLNYLDHHDK